MVTDARHTVIVQFPVLGFGTDRESARRQRMEKILDRALRVSQNGFCDGGDSGSNCMNIFLCVADPDQARETILKALRNAGLLDDAIVVYSCSEEPEPSHVVWWPVNFRGNFSLFGTVYENKAPVIPVELKMNTRDSRGHGVATHMRPTHPRREGSFPHSRSCSMAIDSPCFSMS
jgi:hypothetical protein